ncbi:MAG: acetate kinase [Eubacterium sp.]|nr:acetate kinase [Eubacterium sp.]
MKILVINAGSTTLKYQLIDTDNEQVLAKGLCERIFLDGQIKLDHPKTGEKILIREDMPDHGVALKIVIRELLDPEHGALSSLDEIDAVGHRVVHGGETFSSSVLVNDRVLTEIEAVSDLAPLHNPANLLGIRACMDLMPGVPNVAVFDTAFHQTMPEKAYMYGIPYRFYEKYKIRKYGFHGTSHSFVSQEAARFLDKPVEETKIIVCHLGGGASVTAVKGGKSVDTSMGLTPLEGLIMGTRSGSLDPAVLQFIGDKEKLSFDEVLNILNKESGLYGLSGLSSDMRDIDAGVEEGNPRAKLAFDAFCYQIIKTIGAYAAAMNGVDLIAFTAGIGEWDSNVRKEIIGSLTYLGLTLDDEANEKCGFAHLITTPDSKVKCAVIPTNEELAIARETLKYAFQNGN